MIRVCPTCQQKYPEDTEFCAQDGARLEEMQDDSGDALIGRVLDGRWEIEERIGEGGMGAVYLASQRSVDRQVAIKTLRPELCNSREFVDRFFREARVASNIAHPHCVTILDFGQTDDGTLYLAMEFLDGTPLTSRLRPPNLTVREIIEVCIQISSALAAAHGNNVIHRDLKPDNVFLLSISDGSTFTKVLDFGIAKVTDSEEKMTQTGQVFGTPEYMSPEQCRGDDLDGRSDLYSLGCILYRMLGGRPPFEADTPMAVLVSHVSEAPRHVRDFIERDDVPTELTDLCMQLLSKQADGRPEDAQAVRAKLEVMLGHAPTGSAEIVPSPVAVPATSDEHISGETLATDSVELAEDGGTPGRASSPSGQNQRQSGQSQPADASSQPNSAAQQPQEAQRTESTSGHTSSATAVGAPNEKSLLPLILGVGVAVVLAAGCVLGSLYFGYTLFFAEEGETVNIATFLGSDDPDAAGSDEARTESGEDASVDVKQADSHDPDGGSKVANSDDAGQDDDASTVLAANDKTGSESTKDSKDGTTGAKPNDSDDLDSETNQGGTQENTGSSSPDDDEDQSTTKTTKTTKIEINADKAEIAVNNKKDDTSDDEDDSSEGSQTTGTAANNASSKTDTQTDKEQTPPKPAGNIRQEHSTSGSACIAPNVASVLRSSQNKFLSCYTPKLGAQPDLSGKVMLAWNISTEGDILTPEVLVSDVKDLDSCLLGKLKRLRFDATIGGRCYVRATYRFSP
jgi:serine/threonine protein kinase